jgi:hypothetical protein
MENKLLDDLVKTLNVLENNSHGKTFKGICGAFYMGIEGFKECEYNMLKFKKRYKKIYPDEELKDGYYYSFGVSEQSINISSWLERWCKKNKDIPQIVLTTYEEVELVSNIIKFEPLKAWYEPRIKFMEDWIKDLEK